MTLPELVRRVKVVPQSQAEEQIKQFILESVIGPNRKGQVLENIYRRKLRKRVGEME